jgi:transglutaminase-like putative cysteine protease/predicted Zn-dependent protease
MLKTIATLFLALNFSLALYANDYDDAWKAIHNKKFAEAKTLLLKAIKDPATSTDAYFTLLYLQTYQGNENEIPGLADQLMKTADKDAYVYASWFNGSMLGQYSKKKSHQLNLLNKIISDKSFNGSLQSAAHYVKAMHYLLSHDYDKAKQEYALMGAIQDWQFTGPFENLSGSGFNSNLGPLSNAEANAKFIAAENIEVNWFTPSRTNHEGWIFTYAHLPENSAIVYAQAFVNSPEERKVILNLGCNGSIKVWLNDGLVLSESKERATELDYYKHPCTLKKGYNRILLQLGYTYKNNPNFIVRFTDDQFNAINDLTASTQFQSYTKSTDVADPHSVKHFAETFFEDKISRQPSNLVNYILLSQTYLRDERITEARQVIEKGLNISPDNALLKFELVQCLSKADNRTLLSQELDWIKQNDPESYLNYQIHIDELIKEEKYQDAEQELDKMTALYPDDENILNTRINILAKMEKVDDMLKLVEKGYNQYPDNSGFVTMKFRVEKMVTKNSKQASKVYEKYLKDNYSYNILTGLADEYKDQGLTDKYLNILEELYDHFGYDPLYAGLLSKYYYEKGNYAKSLDYAKQQLLLAPYSGKYWQNIASAQEAMGKDQDAIASYKKAIYYDRTNYDAWKKLNSLQGKPDLYKLLPDDDVYSIIKQTPVNKDYDYTYLIDEKGAIVYDEGASEEYITYAVKINTQKGIDTWKETYLSYSSTQSVLVEKLEVVKANGSKVSAERDDDHVVFTGLEPGDAVYVKYRLQNYSSGRLGREFYDKFLFNSFSPSLTARYTLIAPKNFKFDWKVINSALQPVVKENNDVNIYVWEVKNDPALKSEPLMPPLNDVGTVLHISTIKSWQDVAQWYSDLAYQDVTDNIELDNVYKEIFPDKKPLSNLEKARRIHDYIITNIRYSSVSFRQSGLVPQSVSKTISTRLGDCKDLSSLFVALANKAGIPAQLVLIDTRDNGAKDMVLPSMEFNHCVALAKIDGKDYYVELTDSYLPFGSLNYNLNGALSLNIPVHGQKSTSEIKPLQATNRSKDRIARQVNVEVNGKDIKLKVVSKRYGAIVSGWREDYLTLTPDKQKEQFEQSISNGYKNPVKLESVSFAGLDNLDDSLIINYGYTVKNEVAEAGSMRMLKVPFIDLIATLENISSDERKFPIEYWSYETIDEYQTVVTVQLPPGQKFIEIPIDQNLSFKGSSYSLKYIKEGDKLKVVRTAKLQRDNIVSADYSAFKKFFNDIVEAESKYLVFK